MDYLILQPTDDPFQSFYLPAAPDGHAFQARVDLRYLSALNLWVLSISDAVTARVYVNRFPVICSCEELNDLLFPFRYLFQASGIGSLLCLKATDRPSTPDPSRHTLNAFPLLWGNRYV